MPIFEESGLVFDFKKRWSVRKYDEHPFYKAMSSKGMSAVDFVGIDSLGNLFLMEVKNYKNRPEKELPNIQQKLEGAEPPLVDIFIEKVEESIQGISAISTYLNSRWWYRFWFFIFNRPIFQRFLLRFDRLFWMKADQIIKNTPEKIEVTFWLELPDFLLEHKVLIKQKIEEEMDSQFRMLPSSENPYVEVKILR